MRRILFITWDGPQVNYLESLFLPIFVGLKAHGIHTDVLQFRWGDPALTTANARACAEVGIGYQAIGIWRWPLPVGPFVSAALGGRHVRAAARRFGSDILMPRSLMPAMAVLAAGDERFRRIVFDADGLEADERIDFRGLTPSSPVYRGLRRVEAAIVRQSRAVLVRSTFARDVLIERTAGAIDQQQFHIVTNGRDGDLFVPGSAETRAEVRRELGIADEAPVVGYVGSLGGKYRAGQIVAFAAAVRAIRADARLLVLNLDPTGARRLLIDIDRQVGDDALIVAAAPDQVSRYLACMDVGTAFIRRTFSMRAVAPIKTGEYLLCGVPVVGTSGIGDTGPAERADVFFDEAAGADAAAKWVLESVLPDRDKFRERAREIGAEHFSLDHAVKSYLEALAPDSAADFTASTTRGA